MSGWLEERVSPGRGVRSGRLRRASCAVLLAAAGCGDAPDAPVDTRLQDIMQGIHAKCVEHGQNGDAVNYVKGANLGGFIKVADAMLAYGVV